MAAGPACVKWNYYRYYSNLCPGIRKTQCLQHQHTPSYSNGHHWANFSNSTKSLRAPHIYEPGSLPETPIVDPEKLAVDDLHNLFLEIHQELQSQNQALELISKYYFDGKGKAFRPVIVVLMARALNSHIQGSEALLLPSQRKVAMVVEMIHTATLVHDDVIDASNLRRGKPSLNAIWDQNKAILGGDFIISVGAILLARIGNADVVNVIVQVISDLVIGEFMQMGSKENENERFAHYLTKTYKKTASLIANGCKAVAILSGADERLQEIAFQYGRNVGIAFQLVDDLLDFVANSEMLGKPAVVDLKLGLATAPVLFACEKYPELQQMIMRRFSNPGDVETALEAVMKSDGLAQTRFLAEQHCKEAVRCIQQLSSSQEQKALFTITDKVLNRMK